MNQRFADGIWGVIVGDALGAPVEFGERWMRDMDPVKEMRSGGMFEVPIGGWTDDTSMTLATLNSLNNGYDLKDIMEQYVLWLREGKYSLFDYPIGVGKQILRSIEEYEKTKDVYCSGGKTEQDNGNGSLMKNMPICLYCYAYQKTGTMTIQDVIRIIHEVSGLTHNHIRSKIACGIYYFIIYEILEEKRPFFNCINTGISNAFSYYQNEYIHYSIEDPSTIQTELKHFFRLKDLEAFRHEKRDHIRSTGYVVDTLEAAIWCLITENNYKDSLLKAVNLGLDTDTIAAVAGGLAGLYYGYAGIPTNWLATIQKRDLIEQILDRVHI